MAVFSVVTISDELDVSVEFRWIKRSKTSRNHQCLEIGCVGQSVNGDVELGALEILAYGVGCDRPWRDGIEGLADHAQRHVVETVPAVQAVQDFDGSGGVEYFELGVEEESEGIWESLAGFHVVCHLALRIGLRPTNISGSIVI